MTVPANGRVRTTKNFVYHWLTMHPRCVLIFAVLVMLVPFLGKPFNFDDPLFIWSAKQIQLHPADPYGFTVNWYGTTMPMWVVTKNPPLACYYLAGAAAVFGWSEFAMHAAFLLPALAVILGTHRLARQFCRQPMLAALATLFTPVFLVSSTTVMCDVLMLAFWVWAIVFWLEGLRQDNFLWLSLAGLLIGLAALTKYFGISLLPLLAAFTLMEKRRIGGWVACLLTPLLMLCVYQWAAWFFYGYEFLSNAAVYATSIKSGKVGLLAVSFIGLAFTGGCVGIGAFLAPVLWRPRVLTIFVFSALLAAALVFTMGGNFFNQFHAIDHATHAALAIQVVFWAAVGISVLALPLTEMIAQRNAHAWLLTLWVLGTFLFAVFFNWTINGRSILPIAPAMGILLARRWERIAHERKVWPSGLITGLAAGAVLAWCVAWADWRLAVAVRRAAELICAQFNHTAARPLWFEGHWGFQYYMDQNHATALDVDNSSLKPGDTLILPEDNSNVIFPSSEKASLQGTFIFDQSRFVTTFSKELGAGFYTSVWGPLPFVFGHVPPEQVYAYTLGQVALTNNPTSPENSK